MVDWKDTGKTEEKGAELSASDFWVKEPEKPGMFYLAYADTNGGKTYTGYTWYDSECEDCHYQFESTEGSVCPSCSSDKIKERPILAIDFELGRANKLRREKFPTKHIKIMEPRTLKEDYNPLKDDDATDAVTTQEKFMQYLLVLHKEIKEGTLTPSVIIIDSATDVWTIIQEWGLQELIRYHPKYSAKNAKMMRTETQLDWKIMNNRHLKIIQICRAIMNFGVDIYWTARYEGPPDYVKDGTQKIRAQKDVPFYSDIIIHMERRQTGTGQNSKNLYTSHVEKLGSYEALSEPIDRINWRKLQDILEEAKTSS